MVAIKHGADPGKPTRKHTRQGWSETTAMEICTGGHTRMVLREDTQAWYSGRTHKDAAHGEDTQGWCSWGGCTGMVLMGRTYRHDAHGGGHTGMVLMGRTLRTTKDTPENHCVST